MDIKLVLLVIASSIGSVNAQNLPSERAIELATQNSADCHLTYVRDHEGTGASASEIADGASFECSDHYSEYERLIYIDAIQKGFPPQGAAVARDKLGAQIKDQSRVFTINRVLKVRAADAR